MTVYQSLQEKKKNGSKSFAILVDPDKAGESSLASVIDMAIEASADYFFVGGSRRCQKKN